MTLYTTALWFYSVMVSVVFGAGIYEILVVHPAWSRKPPESIVGFVGSPVSRMNLPAFWGPVSPLYLNAIIPHLCRLKSIPSPGINGFRRR